MCKRQLINILKIEKFFINSSRGQGMTEYALILGLVVILGIAILADDTMQTAILNLFSDIATSLAAVISS